MPEHPGTASGRRIALRIIVLPRTGAGDAREPLFFLAGGPGTAATAYTEYVDRTFRSLRASRDIVLVDQRGTGGSNRLDCPIAAGAFFVPADPEGCARDLSAIADLRAYTTDNFVADLEAVRSALGYERVVLYGGSYGTRAAYVYARTHPARVGAVVLAAPAPLSMSLLDSFEEDGRASLDALIAACATDTTCATSNPSLASDVAAVRAREPSAYYALGLQFLLYATDSARRLPALVTQAARGDAQPLDGAIEAFRAYVADVTAIGLHLSVMCSEEVPFARGRAGGSAPANALAAEYARACRAWPTADVPSSFLEMSRLPQPALVLAGERDPVTPPRWGRLFADLFSPGHLVVFAGAGHMLEPAECIGALTRDFLDGRPLDARCAGR